MSGGKHMEEEQLEDYLNYRLEEEEKNGVSPSLMQEPITA